MDPTVQNQAIADTAVQVQAAAEPAVQPEIIMQLSILIGLLVMIALIIGIVAFMIQRFLNPDPSPVELRLEKIRGREVSLSADELEQAEKMKYYIASDYKNPAVGKFLERYGFFIALKKLIQQAAFEKFMPDQVFLNIMLMPVLCFSGLALVTLSPQIFFFGLMIPAGMIGFLIFQKKKRFGLFIKQFPDALSMMTSSLRAGHAFQAAISIISTELAPPMSKEFSDVVKDLNLGIPIVDALGRFLYKMDYMPDVQMFCTAVQIQREAGGNLAEVLDKLGYTIRERFKLKGQIAALTGQSRLTGYVLGLAPVTLLTGLSMFFYDFVEPLYVTQVGQIALTVSGIMQVIGFIIMRKIVDIRV